MQMQTTSLQARVASFEIERYLSRFCEVYDRNLQVRGRRQLAEVIELLAEYLEERGVHIVSRQPARGQRSLSAVLDLIDEFEMTEVQDAFEGNREQLRIADAALRALTRQLRSLEV